jgi:hypothetical protein
VGTERSSSSALMPDDVAEALLPQGLPMTMTSAIQSTASRAITLPPVERASEIASLSPRREAELPSMGTRMRWNMAVSWFFVT